MPAAALQRELHAPLLLTPAQLQFYRDNGFIRLKNVLSADLLAHYRDAVEAAVAAAGDAPLDAQQALDRADDDYAQAFLQVINLWRTSPDVREFVFGQRLAHVAAQLVKARAGGGVRLYHDQALFKAPGGGHTPWHCDQFYWPLASEKTVTAWVPLEAVPEEMGPLQFAAGSHRKDLGRAVGIGCETTTKRSCS
jgi:ectoine hydroxylase-related dioxygenase (phytanoyl-CoA dioxygenase family)